MGDRPTIYDVAREAGVAASTVSRAYARPGRVNAETARAIFAAAERIGYRTGPITGTLGRQTGAVALILVPFVARFVELHLCDCSEPMPETLAVID